MTLPEVSVVVAVRNGEATLPELLGCLAAQKGVRAEVVVVDNASRDASAQLASRAGARVVHEPVPGRARARNTGVAASSAPLIAFTDADCRPAAGWLAALRDCLNWMPLAAGPVELVTAVPPNRWERLEVMWRFRQEQAVRDGWAATANLAVRRAAFEAIGGFDVSYRQIGEDVDFCLRARAAGFELGWCASAVVRHGAERDGTTILRRAAMHGFSAEQLAVRWPGVVGWHHWRHPRPAISGDWALRRFGEGAVLDRDLLWPARLEYAGRVAGSAWAGIRRAGRRVS